MARTSRRKRSVSARSLLTQAHERRRCKERARIGLQQESPAMGRVGRKRERAHLASPSARTNISYRDGAFILTAAATALVQSTVTPGRSAGGEDLPVCG